MADEIAKKGPGGLAGTGATGEGISVDGRWEAALRQSPYLPVRLLRCGHSHGILTIRGQVPTYYLKQIAQSILARLEGVEEIKNQVEVCPAQLVLAE